MPVQPTERSSDETMHSDSLLLLLLLLADNVHCSVEMHRLFLDKAMSLVDAQRRSSVPLSVSSSVTLSATFSPSLSSIDLPTPSPPIICNFFLFPWKLVSYCFNPQLLITILIIIIF